jgi:hypothetical protein
MRYSKLFAWFALVVGMALPGASALSAEDFYGDWQHLRRDSRDIRHDYAQVDNPRSDIARDRVRLNEDIRCGRDRAASQDARDLARDQRALNAQIRDIGHDRADRHYGDR